MKALPNVARAFELPSNENLFVCMLEPSGLLPCVPCTIGFLAPCAWVWLLSVLPVPSTEAGLDGPAIAAIGELGATEEPCELWIACWDWGS